MTRRTTSAVPALLATVACLAATATGAHGQQADFVLTNGLVRTANAAQPTAEAVAVTDGRISFVGSSVEAERLVGVGTTVVNLNGRVVMPGLIDSHGHVGDLGTFLRNVDLFGTASEQEAVDRMVARAAEAVGDGWLLGRGWDQNEWGNTAFPTTSSLDAAIAERPVSLERVDGHALWVNQAALDAAGIDRNTPDPAGGRIVRDDSGEATGVLIDNAMDLVLDVIPPLTQEELREGVRLAQQELNRFGITAAVDAGAKRGELEAMEALALEGELTFRNFAMVFGADRELLADWLERGPSGWIDEGHTLRVDAIKISADGALGSRGAALLEGYADDPDNSGLLLLEPDTLRRIADDAAQAGFQFNVHAIGDRANRIALDVFEETLERHALADHRWRIEHAQIVSRQDLPRFAELGVIPAMQAIHQSSDMAWVTDRLGYSRSLGAYAWRSVLDDGAIIPGGSDFPVESADPRRSLYAAVTRQNDDGWPAGGWFPAERMTREESFLSMTLWGAYSTFADDEIGSVEVGKWADLVVVGDDYMTMPEDEIPGLPILMTILAGEVVYASDDAPIPTALVNTLMNTPGGAR
ncbi:MAG TPA: amidohydrolase [Longimicrobiales bacterium]|nr:amidohydrolase [Longimicrobiales bacterium]